MRKIVMLGTLALFVMSCAAFMGRSVATYDVSSDDDYIATEVSVGEEIVAEVDASVTKQSEVEASRTRVDNSGITIYSGACRVPTADAEVIANDLRGRKYIAISQSVESEEYRLVQTGVNVEIVEDECTGDKIVLMHAECDFVILIDGFDRCYRGSIKNYAEQYTDKDRRLFPFKPIVFDIDGRSYSLTGIADSFDPDDMYSAEGYLVVLEYNGRRQVLTFKSKLEDTIPSIVFFGDIDGDDLPDIILSEPYHYELRHISLYLSSWAGEGLMVGKVAEEVCWWDC